MLYSPNTSNRFSISKVAVDSDSHFFQSTFATDLCDVNISNNPVRSGKVNGYYMNISQEQYDLGIIQVLLKSQNLNETFETLAASMSNVIRENDNVEGGMQKGVCTPNRECREWNYGYRYVDMRNLIKTFVC